MHAWNIKINFFVIVSRSVFSIRLNIWSVSNALSAFNLAIALFISFLFMLFVNVNDFAYVKLFISLKSTFKTKEKKLFLNIYTFSSNDVATTSFKRKFDKRDIFLNNWFFSFAHFANFHISFSDVTSTMFFLNFICLTFLIVFFFCHCFWHIFVNFCLNDFSFICDVIFVLRKLLRNNFEIKTICFRCLILLMILFCQLLQLNIFITFLYFYLSVFLFSNFWLMKFTFSFFSLFSHLLIFRVFEILSTLLRCLAVFL